MNVKTKRRDFNRMTLAEKATVVNLLRPLHKSVNNHYVLHLFVHNDMYIEVAYNHRLQRIVDIYMLEYSELDLHLTNIKLTELI